MKTIRKVCIMVVMCGVFALFIPQRDVRADAQSEAEAAKAAAQIAAKGANDAWFEHTSTSNDLATRANDYAADLSIYGDLMSTEDRNQCAAAIQWANYWLWDEQGQESAYYWKTIADAHESTAASLATQAEGLMHPNTWAQAEAKWDDCAYYHNLAKYYYFNYCEAPFASADGYLDTAWVYIDAVND